MNTNKMQKAMQRVRTQLDRASETPRPDMEMFHLRQALSELADVVDTLIAQQAPDREERAEAEYLEDEPVSMNYLERGGHEG